MSDLPDWFEPLLTRVRDADGAATSPACRRPRTRGSGRARCWSCSASRRGPARTSWCCSAPRHAQTCGQPAFPGGAVDPTDIDTIACALREAEEEVGLDPATVEVVATLPTLWIPVSDFLVTPVVAWWRSPHPVGPADPAEVARVERLPIRDLIDPANRLRVRHPSGWIGPAFRIHDMLVWGFTAGVLSHAAGTRWMGGRLADRPGRGTADTWCGARTLNACLAA